MNTMVVENGTAFIFLIINFKYFNSNVDRGEQEMSAPNT